MEAEKEKEEEEEEKEKPSVPGVWMLHCSYKRACRNQKHYMVPFATFAELAWHFFHRMDEFAAERYLTKYKQQRNVDYPSVEYHLEVYFTPFGNMLTIDCGDTHTGLYSGQFDYPTFFYSFVPRLIRHMVDENISVEGVDQLLYDYLFDWTLMDKLADCSPTLKKDPYNPYDDDDE
jgi:hypothetical protein